MIIDSISPIKSNQFIRSIYLKTSSFVCVDDLPLPTYVLPSICPNYSHIIVDIIILRILLPVYEHPDIVVHSSVIFSNLQTILSTQIMSVGGTIVHDQQILVRHPPWGEISMIRMMMCNSYQLLKTFSVLFPS